jgi:hypothetical protein
MLQHQQRQSPKSSLLLTLLLTLCEFFEDLGGGMLTYAPRYADVCSEVLKALLVLLCECSEDLRALVLLLH